jgi:hypothetical protein
MQKQKTTKKVTTVRFDESELQRIETAALKHHISQAEVIRKIVSIGLVDVYRMNVADKLPDIDGESFLIALKKEFYIQ